MEHLNCRRVGLIFLARGANENDVRLVLWTEMGADSPRLYDPGLHRLWPVAGGEERPIYRRRQGIDAEGRPGAGYPGVPQCRTSGAEKRRSLLPTGARLPGASGLS